MPEPPPIIRQAVPLVAFIGVVLMIGPGREAGAAHCFVPDRPVFGLSTSPEGEARPDVPTGEGLTFDQAPPRPLQTVRHCPAGPPERSSSRLVLSGDSPIEPDRWKPDAPDPLGVRLPDHSPPKPIRVSGRIDRPPR